jgi:galactofuranosylgalactofuranosylrhamnosyl-N-acetylglucosaminyl-diphospho-decaprenol beta-1,5/1,6-galactofuranosyltransferase
MDPKHTARAIMAQIVRHTLAMQYGLVATLIKAAEDYLEGPKILHDGSAGAAAEIRRIRAQYPDTVKHAVTDVPGLRSGELHLIQAAPPPSSARLTLLKRLVYLGLGKTRHEVGMVSSADAQWWHLSQFATAVVTDSSQEGVRIRHRDRQQMISLVKQGAKLCRRLIKEVPRVKQEYRDAIPDLITRENWQRLYKSE